MKVNLKPGTPRCAVCGAPPPGNYALIFNELEGSPSVCGQCVFRLLTGEVRPWDPELLRLVENIEKRKK